MNILMGRYCPFLFQHHNMKYVFVIFVTIVSLAHAQTRAFETKFEITTEDCSGVGITPTEGTYLASQHKKKPFANQTIYMYKKGKCVDSLMTDSLGKVRKRIKYGQYDLFLAYKHKRTVPIRSAKDFDMECMKKEWLKPDGILKLSWKGTHLINKGIGFKRCEWRYDCIKERHIPAGSQG